MAKSAMKGKAKELVALAIGAVGEDTKAGIDWLQKKHGVKMLPQIFGRMKTFLHEEKMAPVPSSNGVHVIPKTDQPGYGATGGMPANTTNPMRDLGAKLQNLCEQYGRGCVVTALDILVGAEAV